MYIPSSQHERIVIVGGGFAGINLARKLVNRDYQVVLINRDNYFCFQPLLYQVATGGLEPNSIAYPLRRMFRKANNIFVRVAQVESVDPYQNCVHTSHGDLSFDRLVIASGSRPNFFGLDQELLLPLKSAPDALRLRNWLLTRMEAALIEKDPEQKAALLNFVIVGGGPTGVELAGALAEMKHWVLPNDYPDLDLDRMQIYLLEGYDRLLPAMSEKSSRKARIYLEKLGVNIFLQKLLKEYDGHRLNLEDAQIATRNLIWTAGVKPASPEGLQEDRFSEKGRLQVNAFHEVEGLTRIYAIGDVAKMTTEEFPDGHPMLAPVAIQQGKHLAKNLLRETKGKDPEPFRYRDRGSMATIGRNKAVADLPHYFLHGFPAWLAWMFLHLLTLIGFRNRLVVLLNWIYSYATYDKALRLIIRKPDDTKKPVYQPDEYP